MCNKPEKQLFESGVCKKQSLGSLKFCTVEKYKTKCKLIKYGTK